MADFFFWLFMLVSALLIPACMLYFGWRFWPRVGRPTLAVSLVWMFLLLGRGIGTVGISAMVLTGTQMVSFLAVIPGTEGALKRKFS